MDDLTFQYHGVDCLYSLYKRNFFGHTMNKTGFDFTQLKRVVQPKKNLMEN